MIERDITDHLPVFLYILYSNVSRQRRLFNSDKYSQLIEGADWSSIYTGNDPEGALIRFYDVIYSAIERSTTLQSSNRRYFAPHCPWFPNSLIRSLLKKDNLYKKTKRQPFNANLKLRYKRYSNTR